MRSHFECYVDLLQIEKERKTEKKRKNKNTKMKNGKQRKNERKKPGKWPDPYGLAAIMFAESSVYSNIPRILIIFSFTATKDISMQRHY